MRIGLLLVASICALACGGQTSSTDKGSSGTGGTTTGGSSSVGGSTNSGGVGGSVTSGGFSGTGVGGGTCFPDAKVCKNPDGTLICVTGDVPEHGCDSPSCAPCEVPHAMATCSPSCSIAACDPGFGDCDGDPATGCETNLALDPGHCGNCANICVLPNAVAVCTNGGCVLGGCNPGFSDCDAKPENGCETNTDDDPTNCGACGVICLDAAPCLKGTCATP
jgi:hypothetical protein